MTSAESTEPLVESVLGENFVSPSAQYEGLREADPRRILAWACETIDPVALATSFQMSGMALLHMARDIKPDIPVLFLETGFHFPETTEFRQRIVAEWNLNFIELRGDHKTAERQAEIYGPELYRRDPDLCCHINKVAPLQTALEGYKGWISGVRRDQSDARSHTPVVQAQLLPSGKEVLKVHPLAFWTKADVEDYVRRNGIPIHPLLERGFASIGCWPCTRPITNGESERAGRWDGLEKTECGIHVFGTSEADSE